MENINWYPGHMKKTRELIQENLRLVDAVIEVIDARIPVSSRNPIIDELVKSKPRIIVLNKSDLADGSMSRSWEEHLRKRRQPCAFHELHERDRREAAVRDTGENGRRKKQRA